MITFPNCKINIGFHVIQKRKNGQHNIETAIFPIPFNDVLEIIPSGDDKTTMTTTGIAIDAENNLCLRAFYLLQKDYHLPSVKIHLHKVIPVGAGLGSGSSNAASTLILLNDIFHLGLSPFQLFEYGSQLTSDCSFFLFNKPCIATGRGESMEVIRLSLSSYKILLIGFGISINEMEIYQQVVPQLPPKEIKDILQQPVSTWKEDLKNDLEEIVFSQYPEIKSIREELYNRGAVYASLNGSSSTVFGIFPLDTIDFRLNENYFQHWVTLS